MMADFEKRIVLASGFGNLAPAVELLLDDDFLNSLKKKPFQGVEDCFLHAGRIIGLMGLPKQGNKNPTSLKMENAVH